MVRASFGAVSGASPSQWPCLRLWSHRAAVLWQIRLRVGIVGASAEGQGWAPISHFPALSRLPEYEIAALCTAHADTAAAAARKYGVANAFHDYNVMVREPDIDLVSVVVKVPNHHEVVMAALNAGKHVYCEWPLGANTAQAEEMAALARSKRVKAIVGLQARGDPAIRSA